MHPVILVYTISLMSSGGRKLINYHFVLLDVHVTTDNQSP